jgi:hypothetical protein
LGSRRRSCYRCENSAPPVVCATASAPVRVSSLICSKLLLCRCAFVCAVAAAQVLRSPLLAQGLRSTSDLQAGTTVWSSLFDLQWAEAYVGCVCGAARVPSDLWSRGQNVAVGLTCIRGCCGWCVAVRYASASGLAHLAASPAKSATPRDLPNPFTSTLLASAGAVGPGTWALAACPVLHVLFPVGQWRVCV